MLIGGPGTGKTSVLNALKRRGFFCMSEISRELIIEAQKKGMKQLFSKDPLQFSKRILERREEQYIIASEHSSNLVFFDRGIPDIPAYLEYAHQKYPSYFKEKSKSYTYDGAFLFKPWKKIFISDNERYESFEEAVAIDQYLQKTYTDLNYTPIEVPFDTIEKRADFILNQLRQDS